MIRLAEDPDADDFQLALDVVLEVVELTKAINRLPKSKGSRVKWPNGVIWTRVGGNAWQPNNLDQMVAQSEPYIPAIRTWPSDHIARRNDFRLFDPLPVVDQEGRRYTDDGYGSLRDDVLTWDPRAEYVQEQENYL